MNSDSAVTFETASRIHMGLPVGDVEKSTAFYRTLFGQEPTKVRPGYARFEVAEPPVNLSLNEVSGPTAPVHSIAHSGIQVKSSETVRDITTRLEQAGLATKIENQVSCCYAVQNKVWATDPDGNRWEVYVVLDDAGTQHLPADSDCCSDQSGQLETACCTEQTGTMEAASDSETAACC